MSRRPLRIVAAVSGGGRTLKNLIEKQHQLTYELVGVIVSRKDCGAYTIAEEFGLPIYFHSFPRIMSELDTENLETWLEELGVDLVALAGFLRPFPILKSYSKRIINIHPALLPKYGGQGMYGARVHEAVWAAKEQVSGATIHFVSEHYDEGALIAQIRIPIHNLASPIEIAQAVFKAECFLYPKVLELIAQGILPLAEGQVQIFEESCE